jgi:hypothetical protein
MNKRSVSSNNERIIKPWVVLSGAAVGILLLISTCLIVILFRGAPTSTMHPTAIVRYIPAPTATQTPLSQNSSDLATATSMPPGENLAIGSNIRVEGTGGDGLRLRSSAGLQGQIKFLVKDGEELIIDDGPKEIDGYIWWHVKSLTDETIAGWGVADYMIFIVKP